MAIVVSYTVRHGYTKCNIAWEYWKIAMKEIFWRTSVLNTLNYCNRLLIKVWFSSIEAILWFTPVTTFWVWHSLALRIAMICSETSEFSDRLDRLGQNRSFCCFPVDFGSVLGTLVEFWAPSSSKVRPTHSSYFLRLWLKMARDLERGSESDLENSRLGPDSNDLTSRTDSKLCIDKV